jgi:hypothetical protein
MTAGIVLAIFLALLALSTMSGNSPHFDLGSLFGSPRGNAP